MRILMLSDVYFPRVNGVSTSIQTFRNAFLAQGHRVTLIAPDYGTPCEDERDILRIPSRKVIVDPEDRMMHYRALTALADRLRDETYDLLHIHTPFVAHYAGLALARRLNLPVIESYHTFFEEYLYNYVRWLPRASLRFAARRFSSRQGNSVDALVVPSTPMRDVLAGYGVTTPMHIIPTGIDLTGFRQGGEGGFRARHGIREDQPLLLFVGRAAHEKNIAFLLRMFVQVRKQRPDAVLVLAGEGPAEHSLKALGEKMGLGNALRFVGYMARNGELQQAYRSADLFVFASRTETQGLVLLESMALGTPVVSTAVMGTRDVLRDGQGCLIAEEEVDDFSAKVLRVINDKALREALSQSALRYVEQWSEAARAEDMLGLYARCLHPSSPHPVPGTEPAQESSAR